MDPVSGKFVVSRDIVFDEASTLFCSSRYCHQLSAGDKVEHVPTSSSAPTLSKSSSSLVGEQSEREKIFFS